MVNASSLPTLFANASWAGGSFNHNGLKLLASINGVWVETVDPDGARVAEEDFLTIAFAAAHADNDGALLINGEKKEIAARPIDGMRWIWIRDPEPS